MQDDRSEVCEPRGRCGIGLARSPFRPARLRYWLLFLGGCLLLLALLHPRILRGMALGLIVDQPVPAEATVVLLAGGDGQFDRAAALLSDGTCAQVLVRPGGPDRLVYLGILPRRLELYQRELTQRGVPPDRVTVLDGYGSLASDTPRQLDRWLAEHPEHHVVVLTDRFRSGELASRYRRVLKWEHRPRVTFRGLPDGRYDESNWWRNRTGIKAFVGIVISRLADRWLRLEELPPFDPDPEAYEQRLGLP